MKVNGDLAAGAPRMDLVRYACEHVRLLTCYNMCHFSALKSSKTPHARQICYGRNEILAHSITAIEPATMK